MASVNSEKTKAQEMLEFALGQKRINFNELSVEESDELLKDKLGDVPLRELRGFEPLREFVTFRPGSFTNVEYHTLDVETLGLRADVTFSTQGFEDISPVTLETHVMQLYRRMEWVLFKRHESEEETNDLEVAYSWGKSAYHHSGSGEILALRRPRNHTRAHENLIIIRYRYTKIPCEKKHEITALAVQALPLTDFRRYFDSLYTRVAVFVISELASAYRQTERELESQLNSMRKKVKDMERLSGALSYPLK